MTRSMANISIETPMSTTIEARRRWIRARSNGDIRLSPSRALTGERRRMKPARRKIAYLAISTMRN